MILKIFSQKEIGIFNHNAAKLCKIANNVCYLKKNAN
jgi:hypothetical protein